MSYYGQVVYFYISLTQSCTIFLYDLLTQLFIYIYFFPFAILYNFNTLMIYPPQEEMDILHDLAMLGNMRKIRERAQHIETLDDKYIPFAKKLQTLAYNFQEQKIMSLIQAYFS